MMQRGALVAIMQSIRSDIDLWPGLKVGLFTDTFVVTDDMTIGGLTAPTYAGYAVQATATLGSVSDNPAGDGVTELQAVVFQPTGATASSVITGWYLFNDAVPDVLIRVEKLETPVTLANALDALVIQPSYGIAGGQGLSDGVA